MYCPFQKITTNYNRMGSKVASDAHMSAETKISFDLCHGSNCAAWDKEKQCCMLCHSTVKGV